MYGMIIIALSALVTSALSIQAPQSRGKSGALLSRGRLLSDSSASLTGLSKSANDTLFESSTASRPPSCIQNTGVGCPSGKCSSSHGEMKCHHSQCFCSAGCSSAKGVCHHEHNVLVASGLRLKNARWPAYYLVASTVDNEIHVSTGATDPLAQFNLYQLPGQGKDTQDFILVPQGSPGYSLSVVHSLHCNDLVQRDGRDDRKNVSVTGQDCKHSWEANMQPMSPSYSTHPSVQDISLHFSQAPRGGHTAVKEEAITIKGSGAHVNKYIFVHEGSWKVTMRPDDPGLGGYWIPEPALAFKFPAFDGPPCETACDSLSVRGAVARAGIILAMAASLLC